MADEQDKVDNQDIENNQPDAPKEEENVDDYFNPFTEDKEDVKDDKVEKKEEDVKDKEIEEEIEEGGSDIENKVAEIEASTMASREITKLITSKPEYAEMSDDLIDLYTKAKVKGHSNPLEFATRNIKPPEYWLEMGRSQNANAINRANQSNIGASTSASKGAGNSAPDFNSMSSEEFMRYASDVENK